MKHATPADKAKKKTQKTKSTKAINRVSKSRSLHDLGDHIFLNLGRRALARLRLGEKGEE